MDTVVMIVVSILGVVPLILLLRRERLDLIAVKIGAELFLLFLVYITKNRVDAYVALAILWIGWFLVLLSQTGSSINTGSYRNK